MPCQGTDASFAGTQEISILKSISYDRNIVQFYGAVLSGSEPMLVLEYMEVRAPSRTLLTPLEHTTSTAQILFFWSRGSDLALTDVSFCHCGRIDITCS